MKFRKMSVPFAPQPGISGIFGRMESAPKHETPKHDLASFCAQWTQKRGAKPLQKLRGAANLQSKNLGSLGLNKIRMRSLVPRERNELSNFSRLLNASVRITFSKLILSVANLICSSVSGPKALKNASAFCYTQLQ